MKPSQSFSNVSCNEKDLPRFHQLSDSVQELGDKNWIQNSVDTPHMESQNELSSLAHVCFTKRASELSSLDSNKVSDPAWVEVVWKV